jgi:predicted nucleic acid-binding protein
MSTCSSRFSTNLHEFWPADISLLDATVVARARVHGPRQVTDLYLLALAVRRGGCLATFDTAIPLSAVPGARPHHLVLV